MSQLNDLMAKLAAQAKTASPLVSSSDRSGSRVTTFKVGKGVRNTFDVEQFGESFTGFIELPTVRLVEMRATWQPMGANNRPANDENPATHHDLIVRFSLRTHGEKIGRLLADGTDEYLLGYNDPNEIFATWANRLHSIEGRIWGADPAIMAKMIGDLCAKHHFTLQKDVAPRGDNPEGRKRQVFVATTPTPTDPNGEVVWEKRGAPVASFTIGRSPNRDQVDNYDNIDRNASFLNFWCGTLQSVKAMVDTAVGNNDAEKERVRGIMYSLTGYKAFERNDGGGTVYVAKDVPFNGFDLGKPDYTPPATNASSYKLRGTSDDKVMTVEEMLALRPSLGGETEAAKKSGRFDDEDEG